MSEECSPQIECERKVRKLDINDPRTYCFNLATKEGDVCLPQSCRIVRRTPGEKDKDEKPSTSTGRAKLIPVKPAIKTCIPWNENSKDKHGASPVFLEETNEPKPEQIESPIHDDIVGNAENASKVSGIDIDETEKRTHDLPQSKGIHGGPSANLASLSDAKRAKEMLESMGALSSGGVKACTCCECDPCTCSPRGVDAENIVAVLKQMMRTGEDPKKLISSLGTNAASALRIIMAKESETAAAWATGGGSNETRLGGQQAQKGGFFETESQKALRDAWMEGYFDEMTSCHCLPGMCPCPGGHYVFKSKKIHDEKSKKMKKKKVRKRVKKIGKDGKEYIEWDWVTPSDSDISRLSDTCICLPTKHFLTPASSGSDLNGQLDYPSKRMYWRDLMVCSCPKLQRTLAIIKPEVVRFKDVVLRAIKNYGLDIIAERNVQLSPEEASEIYAKYYGTCRFPNMVVSISQAPAVVLSLGGNDIVKIWNHMIGPDGTLPGDWFLADWIQKKIGYFGDIVDALHGSKNIYSAENENRYFFPESYIDPIMKNEEDVKEYIDKFVNPTLLKGLALLARRRPIDPIVFLAEWLLTHNPQQPHFPVNIALSSQ